MTSRAFSTGVSESDGRRDHAMVLDRGASRELRSRGKRWNLVLGDPVRTEWSGGMNLVCTVKTRESHERLLPVCRTGSSRGT